MEQENSRKMILGSRTRFNTVFAALATFSRLIGNAVMFVLVARIYGPEQFGQFALSHAFLTTFYLIADFGFDIYVVTTISRHRTQAREIALSLLPLRCLAAILAMAMMWLVAVASGVSDATRTMMIVLSVGIIANAGSAFLFAILRGVEEMHHEAVASLLQSVVLLAMLGLIWKLKLPMQYIVWAFVSTRFLGLALGLQRVWPRLRPFVLELLPRKWKSVILQEMPYGVFLIFGTLYFQLDTILLGYLMTEQVVGIYQAVYKLVGLATVIIDVVVQSVLPTLSRLYFDGSEKWSIGFRFLAKTLAYFGVVVGALMVVYPSEILQTLYGKAEYQQAVPILRVFGCIFFVRSIAETYALMLTTANQQMARTCIVVILTILCLGLNLLAIPAYGALGAAWVSLATNVVAAVFYVSAAVQRIPQVATVLDWRLVASLGVCLALAFEIWNVGFSSPALGGALFTVSALAVVLTVGYSPEERRLAFSGWTRSALASYWKVK